MSGCHGNEIAANVEVCDVILGEVDRKAPTRGLGLEIVIKADGRGGVEEKVRC